MRFLFPCLFFLCFHLPKTQTQRTMGLSMDPLQGNDVDLMKYLQPINVGRDRRYDHIKHDDGRLCLRDCGKYREPRTCYYRFYVEQYTAMGPACRNCSTGNTSNCLHQQCVTADGIEKMIFSINRMVPAPTISVCFGDRIIVDVVNLMTSQSLGLHWHGILQRTTPWMDGIPYVTQCPIPPNGQFRYNFPADSGGTSFYHAHLGNLQEDGLYGSLIVRAPPEMEYNIRTYDFDLPSHTMSIADLIHLPSDSYWPGAFRNQTYIGNLPGCPDNFLVNGRGSYEDSITKTNTPHAEFHVKSGYRYRFRLISSLTRFCLFRLAIQDHNMTIISVDGFPVKPVIVNTIVSGAGQRTDFVIHTNQKPKTSYWIVVSPVEDFCSTVHTQTAYLVYDGANPIPTTELDINGTLRAPYLDNVNLDGCVSNPDVICSDELRAPYASNKRLTSGEPDYRFFMEASFYAYTFTELFDDPVAPYQAFFLPGGEQPPTLGAFRDTLMNNISSMMPPIPLLTDPFPIPENMICHGECDQPFCSCINILEVELDSCVELVLTTSSTVQVYPVQVFELSNRGGEFKFPYFGQFMMNLLKFQSALAFPAHHPFHIHGHYFVVLKMGSQEEKAQDQYWLNVNNATNPAIRDTVLTPTLGFVVVRFIANNPGYWIFHCHIQNHLESGMFLIFKVGERKQMVPPPRNFPKCDPYLPSYRPSCSSSYM